MCFVSLVSRSDTLAQVLDLNLVEDVKGLADLLVEEGLDGEQLLKLAGAHRLEEHARNLAGRHVLRPGEVGHAHLVAVGGLLLELLDTLRDLGEDEVAHTQLVLGLGLGRVLGLHGLEELHHVLHLLDRRQGRCGLDHAVGHDKGSLQHLGHLWNLQALLCTPLGPRQAEAATLVEGRADQADGCLLVDLLAVDLDRACGEEDTARAVLAKVDEGTAALRVLVGAADTVLARLRGVEALLVQLGLGGPREGRRGPGDGRAGHLCDLMALSCWAGT